MVRLYPIALIVSPAGYPKIKKGIKVAATSKYDSAEVILRPPCNTGTSTELMPKANPRAKNIMPMNANGIAKFLDFVMMNYLKLNINQLFQSRSKESKRWGYESRLSFGCFQAVLQQYAVMPVLNR